VRVAPGKKSRRHWWWLAQAALLVALVLGLWHAIGSALRDLEQRRAAMQAEVDQLAEELTHTPAGRARDELQARYDRAQAAVPQWRNVKWWELLHGAAWYALGLAPSAWCFRRLLAALHQPVAGWRASRAHAMGHIGKYVPGKATVLILRVAGVAGPGVSKSAVAIAMVAESLLVMAVGAAIGGLLVGWLGASQKLAIVAAVIGVAAIGPTLPPVYALTLCVLRLNIPPQAQAEFAAWRPYLINLLLCALFWVATGISFQLIIEATPGAASMGWDWHDLPRATAAMALAIVAGFVSFLPGGAGVRELVLTALLEPKLGPSTALAAAVLSRLVHMSVELLVALVLWPIHRRAAMGRQPIQGSNSIPTG
jgi:uncharacterized membrane protein YbhN (UPF0104 family)